MFNENRTFGVEIEFIGSGYDGDERVRDAMRARGLGCRIEGYNHDTQNHWKIVTDCSVSDSAGKGLELVSPPMSGLNGMIQLQLACEALEEAGAKVNRTCGLHVHHDARDFTPTAFKGLAHLYIRFEDTIDELVARSRRKSNNSYCRSVKTWHEQVLNGQIYFGGGPSRLEDATGVDDISRYFHSNRYFKLNFESYRQHGTVEFRQHQGTLNFKKIANWVMLTQAMVERSINEVVAPPVSNSRDSWKRFRKTLKLQGSHLIQYYNKRRKELAA